MAPELRNHARVDRLSAVRDSPGVQVGAIDLGGKEREIGIESPGSEADRTIDVSGSQLSAGTDDEVADALLRLHALIEVIRSSQVPVP
jgi:hypothetical protein